MNPTVDKLALVHVRDRRVLVARSRGRDVCYLPGGKREPGESDHEALAREVREELSVSLDTGTMSLVGTFQAPAHGAAAGTLVRMTCYRAELLGDAVPAAEIEELAWLQSRDHDRCSAVLRLVLEHLQHIGVID